MNACYAIAREAGWCAVLVALIDALVPPRVKR